jgi:pilus assembly protein CpaF
MATLSERLLNQRTAQPTNLTAAYTESVKAKARIQRQLIAELGQDADLNSPQGRQRVEQTLNELVAAEGVSLTRVERARLLEVISADVLSFGPIEPLLHDAEVSEIMVNGPHQVWVERQGVLSLTEIRFDDDDHVRRVIDRIIAPLGRRCDEASPMVDARLPDGSRVNAIIPPLSLIGPVITIRKFSRDLISINDLIMMGTISHEVGEFLTDCVTGRLNLIVSGGTGSGKTTLLNVLSAYVPRTERIITIEDAAELQLHQEHVITLEKRPPGMEGRGEVTIRDLVINALRMRPDRLIVGEVRGPEALDMLQAMNTGHDGSMTTLHSNSPRDTLARLETTVLMAGFDLPHRAIREQIASAVDMIVHLERMPNGKRKVVNVTEVHGLEQSTIVMQDIFSLEQEDGVLQATGIRPKVLDKLERHGIHIPMSLFQADSTQSNRRTV